MTFLEDLPCICGNLESNRSDNILCGVTAAVWSITLGDPERLRIVTSASVQKKFFQHEFQLELRTHDLAWFNEQGELHKV